MQISEQILRLMVYRKNEEEFKSALEKLSKLSDLDEHSKKFFGSKCPIELKSPFSHSNLQQIPNIFTDDPISFKYYYLSKVLTYFAEAVLLPEKIIQRLQLLTKEYKDLPFHITFTAIAVLLKFYMEKNSFSEKKMSQELSNSCSSIKEIMARVMQGERTSVIPEEFYLTLVSLRVFLNHPMDGNLRLQAREVCEMLEIPLSLEQMLCLNVDGLNNKVVEDLVIVIGGTGSGKSTLINYLSGIQYVMKKASSSASSSLTFLEPKSDQNRKPPAKVGNTCKSQTLYPQVVQNHDFSYCDCPGFDDTRCENEQICASLGVPLSLHFATTVRAVIVVMEHSSIMSQRGKAFRDLSQTLSMLFRDPKLLYNAEEKHGLSQERIPILFVISKPPKPGREEIFDPDEHKKESVDKIKDLYQSRRDVYDKLDSDRKEEIEDLKNDIRILDFCVNELNTHADQKVQVDNIGMLTSAVLYVLPGSNMKEDVEKGRIEKKIQMLSKAWEEKQSGSSSKLQVLFREVQQMNKEEGAREIQRQKEAWVLEKADKENRLKKLQVKFDSDRGEREILKLIMSQNDNIFVIRCYRDSNEDKHDHKNELLEYLKNLKEKNKKIDKKYFNFDPDDKIFENVFSWVKACSHKLEPRFREFYSLPKRISKVNESIPMVQKEINNNIATLQILMKPKKDPDAKLHPVINNIENCTKELKNINDEINTIQQDIKNKGEQILKINTATEVEFGSQLLVEKRNEWVGFLSWTSWSYMYKWHKELNLLRLIYQSIFEYPEDAVIPIERVQLSCVVDNSKLVFSDTINNCVHMGNFGENAVAKHNIKIGFESIEEKWRKKIEIVEPGENMKKTGYFMIDSYNLNLEEGKFSFTYYSNQGEDGIAGVRFFVLPRNLPDGRSEIDTLNKAIAELRSREISLKEKKADIETRLGNYMEHKKLIESGLAFEQLKKVETIKKILILLDWNNEKIMKEYFMDVETQIQWVKREINFENLKKLARFDSRMFKDVTGYERDTYCTFVGIPTPENSKITDEKDILQALFKKVPPDFLRKMYDFSKKTGLTIDSMRSLQNVRLQTENSLPKKIENLEREMNVMQFYFDKLKSMYLSNVMRLQAVDTIISVFGSWKNRQLGEFIKCYKEIEKKGYRDMVYKIQNAEIEQKIKENKEWRSEYEKCSFHDQENSSIMRNTMNGYVSKKNTLKGCTKHGKEIYLEEFEPHLDGEHGFLMLGMSREEGVSFLLKHASVEKVRNEMAAEISIAFKSNSLGYASTQTSRELFSKYTLGNHELSPEIAAYLRSEEMYKKYVETLGNSKGIGFKTALLCGREKKRSISIWKKKSQSDLELIESYDDPSLSSLHFLNNPDGRISWLIPK